MGSDFKSTSFTSLVYDQLYDSSIPPKTFVLLGYNSKNCPDKEKGIENAKKVISIGNVELRWEKVQRERKTGSASGHYA